MKKILKEWKNYISETKRKHPIRPQRVFHDRTATAHTRQQTQSSGDPRSELRYLVGNITYIAADPRSVPVSEKQLIELVESSSQRQQLIDDLKLIHYLINPKYETKYIARSVNGKMIIFNDTGPLAPDSASRIEYLLYDLGESPVDQKPAEDDLKEIFYYYIAPTNQAFWPDKEPEPEPPTDFMKDMFGSMFKEPEPEPNRFSHALKIDPKMQKQMDDYERAREARITAARRAREARLKRRR